MVEDQSGHYLNNNDTKVIQLHVHKHLLEYISVFLQNNEEKITKEVILKEANTFSDLLMFYRQYEYKHEIKIHFTHTPIMLQLEIDVGVERIIN